jgi:hypothetical protein
MQGTTAVIDYRIMKDSRLWETLRYRLSKNKEL